MEDKIPNKSHPNWSFSFKTDMSKPTQKGQIVAQTKRLNQRYSLLPAGKAHILGDKRTHMYIYIHTASVYSQHEYVHCVYINI